MPASAARIGVPSGTAMSIPSCIWPQRIPKPETTGPSTGQISCPEPYRIGPAGSGEEDEAPSWAAISAWISATVALELLFVVVDLREHGLAVAPRVDQLRLALPARLSGRRPGPGCSAAIASRADSIRELRRAQPRDGALHLVAELADPVDHGFVHPVDPFQVLGLRRSARRSRRRRRSRSACPGSRSHRSRRAARAAPPGRAGAGPDDLEVLLGDIEFGDGGVEFGLLGVEPLFDRRLLAAQRPRPRPSAVRSGRGNGRSSSSARPRGRGRRRASLPCLRVSS